MKEELYGFSHATRTLVNCGVEDNVILYSGGGTSLWTWWTQGGYPMEIEFPVGSYVLIDSVSLRGCPAEKVFIVEGLFDA